MSERCTVEFKFTKAGTSETVKWDQEIGKHEKIRGSTEQAASMAWTHQSREERDQGVGG